MMPRLTRGSRRIAAIVLLLALGTGGAYAYTNSISVNGGSNIGAGYGTQAVSGFTVSNVQYVLNASTPQDIESVKFDLASTVGSVPVSSLNTIEANLNNTWYTCIIVGTSTVNCPTTTPSLTVSQAQSGSLQVVAAQ